MSLESLQKFLGGAGGKQQDYADFLHRFQQDPNSISADEASQRYRELLRNASPAAVSEAYDTVLGQLAPEQRRELAAQFQSAHEDPRSSFNGFRFSSASQASDARTLGQMAQQAEQQDPGLLDRILGQNSPLNSTLGRLALAGIAAYLAQRALSQQPNQQPGQASPSTSPGLPGMIGALGGLLGALSQAQQSGQGQQLPGGLGGLIDILGGGQAQSGNQSQGQGQGLPGGLGGLLDALSRGQAQPGGQSQGQGIPGGLGGLIDILGGQAQAGGQGQGGLGGLGGLLDALGGGQQPAQDSSPAQGDTPGIHVKGSQKNNG